MIECFIHLDTFCITEIVTKECGNPLFPPNNIGNIFISIFLYFLCQFQNIYIYLHNKYHRYTHTHTYTIFHLTVEKSMTQLYIFLTISLQVGIGTVYSFLCFVRLFFCSLFSFFRRILFIFQLHMHSYVFFIQHV